ncbi:MAG: hypothetical protein ACLP8S_30775 [Solirubrobacteraceae bacterium]
MTVAPPLPKSVRRPDLEAVGFVGWTPWKELLATDLRAVPAAPAAYVVYRSSEGGPVFIGKSPAGHFKGKDPTVPIAVLTGAWVTDSAVLYIGKADVANRRLKQFARFGVGEPVGHWGGRYIWQLAGAADLLVAWHPISWGEPAREYEKRLLALFAEIHGARPFANLTG